MENRFFPHYPNILVTSRFGMRTLRGQTKMHNGIDLVATSDGKTGQTDQICAHSGGTVESVGSNSSAGNYIRIRTDSRTVMVYYHLKNKSSLKKGELVAQGQIIGYMGKTGNATGPHLHWGIQLDGNWVDPEEYLDKDWRAYKQVSVKVNVLQKGAKGESVRVMQQLLILRGFDCGEKGVDGSFGKATLAALTAFQSAAKLEADGSCGQKTWQALLGQ